MSDRGARGHLRGHGRARTHGGVPTNRQERREDRAENTFATQAGALNIESIGATSTTSTSKPPSSIFFKIVITIGVGIPYPLKGIETVQIAAASAGNPMKIFDIVDHELKEELKKNYNLTSADVYKMWFVYTNDEGERRKLGVNDKTVNGWVARAVQMGKPHPVKCECPDCEKSIGGGAHWPYIEVNMHADSAIKLLEFISDVRKALDEESVTAAQKALE